MSNNERFSLLPIRHEDLWREYKTALDCLWKVEEVDMSSDYDDWANKLNDDERHYLKYILAFFATADVIVNANIVERVRPLVPEMEARMFYDQQILIENIHTEMYGLLVQTYIRDNEEFRHITEAIKEIPAVRRKAEWALNWTQDEKSTFAECIIAFAIVEGIAFSGSFASIFYFKDKKKGLLPGLTFSNELISRDESIHTKFACYYYNNYIKEEDKVAPAKILKMLNEAVEIEKSFFRDALPCAMIGMNSDLMSQYIEFVADFLLEQLNLPKHYNVQNPFEFMNNISMMGKTNFFEKRVGEYKRFGAGNETYEILEDF
ncbi:RR2 [Rachiplusia nu nucleopolyhedrovirus]|uniref:ribonucleoside-diphosphate reductase n=1 Tax=Rachiplusia nu nucleopolyhedrovirus TaxID=2605775 RepID=A0AAF1DB62_9ABAC|nr:RR2 [Rachiplusia nu nucleopolyhedrovirus]QEI03692.1 RR2 [Rachiplusia nu nucleopolyhedrovirus]